MKNGHIVKTWKVPTDLFAVKLGTQLFCHKMRIDRVSDHGGTDEDD